MFRDIGKRRQFEEQATHAQKMEAVGRLAGGVAGDFNNMLTVIAGYAEMLRGEVPAGSPAREHVDEIVYAGERAATLTQHLLAFSRGGAAHPLVLDLNMMLSSMEPMLRRLLGRNIELLLLTAPGLGRIRADPVQIEQMIVNLATNARDAMPNGGKLVIETANVDLEGQAGERLGMKPGPCVMLAVSDNGIGMDPETRSRLFEPFFTTKEPGKGSGLGLSTVYGAVKQADGQVTVYSQPNCGTIFEIYLPRVEAPVVERAATRTPMGSETILLVDDEEGVRKLCCAVLQAHGYHVLEAGNGESRAGRVREERAQGGYAADRHRDAADGRVRTGARGAAADTGAEDPLHVRVSRQRRRVGPRQRRLHSCTSHSLRMPCWRKSAKCWMPKPETFVI